MIILLKFKDFEDLWQSFPKLSKPNLVIKAFQGLKKRHFFQNLWP